MSFFAKRIQEKQHLCKAYVALVNTRHGSTAPTEAKPQRISKNISYRPSQTDLEQPANRPLVLLFGWMVAKAKHIHKYGDFYLDKGFDVLHIKVSPGQILWPKKAQAVAQGALEFATDGDRQKQPILVHSFSVGGYLYGETLVKAFENEKYNSIEGRIRGQIFDSVVDFEGIANGMSRALMPNRALQKAMELAVDGYLNLFTSSVMKHYLKSSATFRSNKLKTPSMFLYSKADPVGSYNAMEELIGIWKQQGIHVESKDWVDSKHVSHFHKYPLEYIGMLNMFLQKIGMVTEAEQDKMRASQIS